MDPDNAVRVLTDRGLTLAIFRYRVARMVQDNVRADPDVTFEAALLAMRARHAAADGVAYALLALLDAPLGAQTAPDSPGEGGA